MLMLCVTRKIYMAIVMKIVYDIDFSILWETVFSSDGSLYEEMKKRGLEAVEMNNRMQEPQYIHG
jgi:hypothetical protein